MENLFSSDFLQSLQTNPFRTTISKQGNFTKTLAHQSYASDQINILCQGYGPEGCQAAQFIFNILKNSLFYILGDVNQNTGDFKQISKQMLGNLLESCFQQLKTQNIHGSVSFAFSCRWDLNNKTHLTILKNQNLDCYIAKQSILIPLKSHNLPYKIQKSQNVTEGFISSKKIYNKNMLQSKQLQFCQHNLNLNEDNFLLLGSACVFSHFKPQQILQFLKQASKNKKQDVMAIGAQIMKEAKKRWRTIYQQDMSLILARI